MLASSFGDDVYAVSEDMFEDLCVICWNLWQSYVGKVNLHRYDVIKHYVDISQSERRANFAAHFVLVSCIVC